MERTWTKGLPQQRLANLQGDYLQGDYYIHDGDYLQATTSYIHDGDYLHDGQLLPQQPATTQ